MRGLAGLACLLVAGLASAGSARAAFTVADYWSFADRHMSGLDHRWREDRLAYTDELDQAEIRENAGMLLAHAIAAFTGHVGPTREDARARMLVDRLTMPPAWLGTGPAPSASASTCWSADLDRPVHGHMSLEPKVADALAWAWRARVQLGLSPTAVERIVATVGACAASPAWRYPQRLLNQINWNSEMYAAAATVTGRPDLLIDDYRRQLGDFAAGLTRPMPGMKSANLGAGYAFRYRPDHRERASSNLDTPEYANITVHALMHYEHALRLGMQRLPARSERRLGSWMLRLLAGSWTHAGYLNWDTSRGLRRWHSGQYWAYALQGLQTIAVTPRFWRNPEQGAWAKSMFDQGLALYRRLANESGDIFAPRLMFNVDTRMSSNAVYRWRILASVARAIALGLGRTPAVEPPPLWAYDPDTGRLAVTTPRYSTAIVPDDRDAMGYGGVELARLFGPGQRVASGTGGGPPGAFGVVVSDRRGRMLLASQRPRDGLRIRVVQSPAGNLASHARAYPRAPYAGPFARVEVRGTVRRPRARVDVMHTFRPATIDTRWRVHCRRLCPRVRAHFPTWRKRIVAVLHGGKRVHLGPSSRVRLSAVRRVMLGHYRITHVEGPSTARLFTIPAAAEATNPSPAPSLAVQVAGRRSAHLAARVEPTD
jgi:hypothetical protein